VSRADKMLLWEVLARNRWPLLGVLGSFLLSCALTFLRPFTPNFFMPVQFTCLLLGMATIFWVFCMAEPDERGKRSGFPTHLFILPVPTWRLTIVPMISGIAVADAFYFAWCKLIFPSWPIVLPNSWLIMQLLAISCMMASAQAIAWSLVTFPLIRLFAATAVLVALATAGIGIPSDDFKLVRPLTLAAIFGGVLIVSFAGGIAGVTRDRRSEWVGWTGKLLQALLDSMPARRRSFPSPAAAQFWWDRSRRIVVASVLFAGPALAIVPMFPVHAAIDLPRDAGLRMVCTIPIVALIMAGIAGQSLAQSEFRSSKLGISPFVAVRPISTFDLVIAKLKLLTSVALLGWTLVILLSPVAFSLFYLIPHPYLELPSWREFFARNRDMLYWLSHPAIVAGIFAATWQSMVCGLSLGLLGHSWKGKVRAFLGLSLFVTLLTVALWAYEHPSVHFVALRILAWLPVAIAAIKLVSLKLAFQKAAARGLVDRTQLKGLLGVLLLVWAAIIWALASMVSAHVLSLAVAAFMAAYWMPGAELPRCFLHLDHDRHR
jgi:hypothetical protein